MERYHEIHTKGYYPSISMDNQTGRKFADLYKGYGKIIFKGTEEEFDLFYDRVIPKSEMYMKVIGGKSFDLDNYEPLGKLIFTKDIL